MKSLTNLVSGTLTLVFLLCIAQALNADTIKIAVIDYCPYQCDPEKENGKQGFMPEIAKSIFEKAGHSVIFKRAPFKRTIVGTENGTYDAVLNTNTEHSKVLLLSEEESGILKQKFYVKKGSIWKYDGVKSLEGIVVGSVIGYNYSPFSPDYEAYLQKNKDILKKVQYIGGDEAPLNNFMRILRGRITTFNEDAALFEYVTMQAGIADMFDVAGSLGENSQYMGFSPKNPNSMRYAELFNKGIREMRYNGKLFKILSKYGIEDWKNE